jgi:ribonuclease Z
MTHKFDSESGLLKVAGIDLDAISVGGVETCIQIPSFDLAFDIGRCPRSAVKRSRVLFSHAHMDHMGGMTWHCATRSLQNLAPPTYLVPQENEAHIKQLFEASKALDQSELDHSLIPMQPGHEYALSRHLSVRAFRSFHVVPTLGYAIWEKRKKLKKEYRHLDGDQIRKLKLEKGIDVDEIIEIPKVAFCGDTLIDVVEKEEVVRQAKLLILECTFVDERVPVDKSRRHGHIHLDEIVERADLFENEHILLTHFSARYRQKDILENLKKKLPQSLADRVTPLINAH